MNDDDAIGAAVEARHRLHAWSRDTGIAKHGDLTQMDRHIGEMVEASNRRKLAAWKREFSQDRER